MGVPLCLLVSGDVIFVGLGVVTAGVLTGGRHPGWGTSAVLCGLVLALVPAVPIHPLAYATLSVAGAAFVSTRRGVASGRLWARVTMLVTVVVICGIAMRWRLGTGSALPTDRPVFVIGDSLSAGLGASPAGTWPHLLAERRSLRLTNLSRAGATLSSSLRDARSLPSEPAVVIVELGGNDVLGGSSPEQFASDLETLLMRWQRVIGVSSCSSCPWCRSRTRMAGPSGASVTVTASTSFLTASSRERSPAGAIHRTACIFRRKDTPGSPSGSLSGGPTRSGTCRFGNIGDRMRFPPAIPELPVDDVRAAGETYARQLGFTVDWTHEDAFAGISRDDARVFLRRRTPEEARERYCVLVWLNLRSMAEVDQLHAEWKGRGVAIVEELRTTPYNLREFTASDGDGNRLRAFYDLAGDGR